MTQNYSNLTKSTKNDSKSTKIIQSYLKSTQIDLSDFLWTQRSQKHTKMPQLTEMDWINQTGQQLL